MSVALGRNFITDVGKALGLPVDNVTGLTIEISTDEIVTVTAQFTTNDRAEQLTELLKRYALVELADGPPPQKHEGADQPVNFREFT